MGVAVGALTFAEGVYCLQIVMAGVVGSRFCGGHLFIMVVLMLWQRLLLRGHATGQQRRQYSCRHGGARESPKNHNHHQDEIEPTTHR